LLLKFVKLYTPSQLAPVNIVCNAVIAVVLLLTFVLVVAKPFTALVDIELFGNVIVPVTVKPPFNVCNPVNVFTEPTFA